MQTSDQLHLTAMCSRLDENVKRKKPTLGEGYTLLHRPLTATELFVLDREQTGCQKVTS